MNKRVHRILLAMAVLFLGTAAGACSHDSSLPSPSPDSGTIFGITLTVGNSPSETSFSTKTPSGDYDPGAGFENHIDIEGRDLRLYFFDKENKFIAPLAFMSVIPGSETPGAKRYMLVGTVPDALVKRSEFKLVMLANWKDYPQLREGDGLETLWEAGNATVYEYNSAPLSESNLIPLYGIREFSGISFQPDSRTELGTLHLLRAYAKVEVRFEKEKMVNTVKKVTATRVNAKGFKAPSGVDEESDYVHGNHADDYTAVPNIPEATTVLENVSFSAVETGDYYVHTVFLPEYDNLTEGAQASRIRIEYNEDGAEDDYVDFKFYTGERKGDAFNLLRNCWYRFTVNQRDARITVDVQPYAEVVLHPNFGFERDNNGNIVLRNDKGEITKVINTSGVTEREYIYDYEVGEISIQDNLGRTVMIVNSEGDRFIKNYDFKKDGVEYVEDYEANPEQLLYFEWYKPSPSGDGSFWLYKEYDIYKHVSEPVYEEKEETDENGNKYIKRYLKEKVSYASLFKDSQFDRWANVIQQYIRDIPADDGWPAEFITAFESFNITSGEAYWNVKYSRDEGSGITQVYYNVSESASSPSWVLRITIDADGSQTYH